MRLEHAAATHRLGIVTIAAGATVAACFVFGRTLPLSHAPGRTMMPYISTELFARF